MRESQERENRTVYAIAAGSGFGIIAWVHHLLSQKFHYVSLMDPDRYYNLAISKLGQEASFGVLRALPQASDIAWSTQFLDKEFLFHKLLGWIPSFERPEQVFGLLLLFTVYVCGLILWRGPALQGVIASVLGSLLCGVLMTEFLFRIILLRSYVLASLFFCILTTALIVESDPGSQPRSKTWARGVSFFAALCFSLSYHAVFVPLIALGLGFCISMFNRMQIPRGVWLGLFGLTIGILINPYFPQSVLVTLGSFMAALDPHLERVSEVMPMTTQEFLMLLAFPLFLIGATFRTLEPRDRFLWFLTTLLFGAALFNPRTREYGFPLLALLLVRVGLQNRAPFFKRCIWVLGIWIFLQGPSFVRRVFFAIYEPPNAQTSQIIEVVKQVPEKPLSETPLKVFNTEWEAGAYFIYFRPDLHFVDMIDPVYLRSFAPKKDLFRQRWMENHEGDPWKGLRELFHADFVLSYREPFISQLKTDPHFTLVAPKSEQVNLNYVSGPGDAPRKALAQVFAVPTTRPPQIVLFKDGAMEQPYFSHSGECKTYDLSAYVPHTLRKQGRGFLSLGGMGKIKLGSEFRAEFQSLRMGQALIPFDLAPPIKEVELCGEAKISIALYFGNELELVCKAKGYPESSDRLHLRSQVIQASPLPTCLGLLAYRNPYFGLRPEETRLTNHSL